ncbi:phage baseplate assembly protein V [Novosphingobium colocasiae]|uniref:phage baseplate assembly protein V n=1 Tax=Novosphingobium colocasiae TaxID=1256513 RepID=UPI0035B37278
MARIADPEHLAGELIQLGTVASVDYGAATCTVEIGDLVTGDLPWLAPRAGGVKVWSPPSVGEQCALLCPEGDLASGIVLLGIWSDANPPPSNDPAIVHLAFPDGAAIAYNHGTHALALTLPAGGTMEVYVPGGTKWNGDIDLNGNLTTPDDVIAGGVSLKNHTHGGVTAGGAQTGAPA